MRRLNPCSNCGMFGGTTITSAGVWGIFCGACRKGYVSRFLWLAIRKWNKAWNKRTKGKLCS